MNGRKRIDRRDFIKASAVGLAGVGATLAAGPAAAAGRAATPVSAKIKNYRALGRTGFTGMAGGDHLHFSMILQGEFVDPREWWDPQWHRDQLQGPLSRVRASEEPSVQ